MSDDFTPPGFLDFVSERDRIGRDEFQRQLASGKIRAFRLHPKSEELSEVPADHWLKPSSVRDIDGSGWMLIRAETMGVQAHYQPYRLFVPAPKQQQVAPVPVILPENKGGRKPKWDWDGAFIEMARLYFVDEDPPKTRSEMNDRIAEWFVKKSGSEPATSLLRGKVKRFWEAFASADN